MAHLTSRSLVAALALTGVAVPAVAQEVNVYSSRHYDTDEALYDAFTEETGITVNRIEADADELIARLEAEGENSPADVLITVDAGRMARAEELDLLAAYESQTIEDRIPDHLEHPENLWYGIAQRARIIYYDKEKVENPPQTYEELADPAWEGKICIRSSSNIYNQSLMASIIETHGEEAAKEWAQGIVNNMARDPQGGDTDQLRGIVSGECEVAVGNHYYFVRGFESDVEGLSDDIDKIGWVWPNQDGRGTHVNLSTAAMLKTAPNPDNAMKLMEYFTSDTAQTNLATGNHEYPAVEDAPGTATTERLGEFKADETTPTAAFSRNASKAQELFNAVGWD